MLPEQIALANAECELVDLELLVEDLVVDVSSRGYLDGRLERLRDAEARLDCVLAEIHRLVAIVDALPPDYGDW